MNRTFLDEIVNALKAAAAYNQDDVVRPTAVLWPDEDNDWAEIVPELRYRMRVLTLGKYDPERSTGPAIWIRCMLARKLDNADWPEDATPVVYLPGHSRAELRAAEQCPEALKPLMELQYRGVIWSQKNGRDWTLSAFLQSRAGGLGIPVASDRDTSEALKRVARELLLESVDHLRAKAPLRAGFFNALLAPDITRQVLLWMNDPEAEKARLSEQEWDAFCDQCRGELGLDPERDGEVTAARKLGKQEGLWAQVFSRFKEAPESYPNVPQVLRKAGPQLMTLFERPAGEAWPQDNEVEETTLRQCLLSLRDKPPEQAHKELARLENQHGHRRQWVWAKLGKSPMAVSLQHLYSLSQLAGKPPGGGPLEDLSGKYFADGWKVDLAAFETLGSVREMEDVEAVAAALDALYVPWLRDLCESFQAAWDTSPPSIGKTNREPEGGVVFLFVDALRMDLAHALKESLAKEGLECEAGFRLTPLPSITETGKPAASPVAGELSGGPGMSPTSPKGASVNADVLRKLLEERGFSVLSTGETGNPEGSAWTECGRLDEIGHVEGRHLAHRATEEIEHVSNRVKDLVNAGWREVRVVTDHGWLLLPSGLPTYGLPEAATEIRKGRCARLKPGAAVDCQTVPWHWDPSVSIAVAPGIKCFVAGKEYEHGGMSPQEVVVPELVVRPTEAMSPVRFEEVRWAGLRCKARLSGAPQGACVDLRTKPADPGSSVAGVAKQVGPEGGVSLVCPDESLEGSAAVLVAYHLDKPGRVLAQYPTVIGGGGGVNGEREA